MIVHEYSVYCSGRGSHVPRSIGPLRVTEMQDAAESFEISHAEETSKLRWLRKTGTYYLKCPACAAEVRQFGPNLAKSLVKIGETIGVLEIDMSLIPTKMP